MNMMLMMTRIKIPTICLERSERDSVDFSESRTLARSPAKRKNTFPEVPGVSCKSRCHRRRSKVKQNGHAQKKHPMGNGCKCKYKCSDVIDLTRRRKIWDDFWKQDYISRKNWIYHAVDKNAKKRKTAGDCSKRVE